MDDKRVLLRHFLAALAYRTQKAVRDAPQAYYIFRAEPSVRTPLELIRHIESVLGYARTFFIGGEYNPEPLSSVEDEVLRLHATIEELAWHIENGTPFREITPERLLQGPFSDAMTHAGQLAMLRRLAGAPVPPENFVYADISPDNLGPNQPAPARPGDRNREWDAGDGLQVATRSVRAQCAATIRALDEEWIAAATRRDLDGMMAIYAEDAEELLPDLQPIVGRAAIRAFYGQLLEQSPRFAPHFDSRQVTVAECADLAVVEGTYRFTPDTNDVSRIQTGKFIGIWRLIDGDWRLWRIISNASPSQNENG